MTLSLMLVLGWALAANVLAMLPVGEGHGRHGFFLITLGIPLLGYVTWQSGPWLGLLALMAGISILRWPFRFLGRWILNRLGRGA